VSLPISRIVEHRSPLILPRYGVCSGTYLEKLKT
jgi:hypothetical protein